MMRVKIEYPREKKDILGAGKGNNDTSTSHNHDIKCFHYLGLDHVASQYLDKRVMVMKTNNKVEIDGEDEEEKMSPLKDADDVCVEYQVEGNTCDDESTEYACQGG
jgi:hypothetical protein